MKFKEKRLIHQIKTMRSDILIYTIRIVLHI